MEPTLTDREKNLIRAAIKLNAVNTENNGFVPDFHLIEMAEKSILTVEELRVVRDVVQAFPS